MDAKRIADELPVYIKRVKTGGEESRIAMMLSSERLRQDNRNHCVQILDVFPDDQDPSISYMVMPFLRSIVDPAFDLIEEFIAFIDQILEVSVVVAFPRGDEPLSRCRVLCSCTNKEWRMGRHAIPPLCW